MGSLFLARSLGMMMTACLVVAPVFSQDHHSDNETDSANSIKTRIDKTVDEVIESIQNEFRMNFGQVGMKQHHDTSPRDSSSTFRSDEEFAIDGSDSTISYYGNTFVGESDTLRGWVIVSSGTLTVNGRIEGSATVTGGSIIVNSGGRITGDATTFSGKIIRNDGGSIGGVMYESSEEPDEPAYRRDRTKHRFASEWKHDVHQFQPRPSGEYDLNWLTNTPANFESFMLRYNRVEGLFLGIGREERKPWETRHNTSFYGSVGYGFAIHRWQYNLGLDLMPGSRDRAEVGIEYHSLVDTRDAWIMNRNENTAAAFLIHEDFFDYYGRKGIDIHAALYPARTLRARIDYLADEYETLPLKTGWSLFGEHKQFRPNPPIDGGMMRSIVASLDFSTVRPARWMRTGWDAHASAEYSGDNLGGIFSFHRYLIDLRRYQPLGEFSKLSTRVMMGSANGVLPLQKMFVFGGIGTMNAYRFMEFSGNRMALANVEYMLHGGVLEESDFWPLELLSPFSFILFLDAGWSATVSPDLSASNGFQDLALNSMKSDVGVGIGSRDGTLRVAWAWRTDHRSSPVLFFRISRPF